MSIEPFATGSKQRRASWRDIQQIKKNMQKVPVIQEKSEAFHDHEQQHAEKHFADHVDQLEQHDTKIEQRQAEPPTPSRRKRLFARVMRILYQ